MDSIINAYKYINEDLASPVTKDWFLVSTPWPVLGIVACYLFFCTRLGPYFMSNKEPYELKTAIKLYNIFQVLISSFLVYEGFIYVSHQDYDFKCQAPDDVDSPRSHRIARNIYIYFALKLIELLDTIFFVLRKSYRQVSSLHLHHHSLMPMASWIAIKYIPGGQCVLVGWVNSFVHVIMYGYYLISGMGPQYKKYLWWKKYVTVLQLVQFAFIFCHSIRSLFYPCGYPTAIKYLTVMYSIVFMNMFGQFYYQSYVKPKKQAKKSDKNGVKNGVKKSRVD
ncbi:elongation of very long chain fatty acids protein AAEL008004-like [Colias croceus]|uniref:elongation of very long chain fatty acids protein AAEL008004-like n=1 Tax=Colias crocea TaxID=72248 RepID=UPI001E27DC0B|nr:elongation of very long chain fatty acids protein AAEL008004-like [Colias croceus]